MEGAGSGATGGASTKKAADKEERVSTSHSKSSNAAEGWTAEKAEDDGENMERGGNGEDGEKEGGEEEEEEEEEGEADLDLELPDTVTAGQVDRLLQGMSLEPERKHAAQDIFLALNNWAPAGQVSEPGDHDHDAWRQRMGAVEAERRAAAEEATEWFKQADERSLKESDFDGLARQKHIMDARLAPWSKDVSEQLVKTGLSQEYAEKVVREYEPQIFASADEKRRVEDSWRETAEERARKAEAVIIQGWLWKLSVTGMTEAEAGVAASKGGERMWCTLSGRSGVSWMTGPGEATSGVVSFEGMDRIHIAKYDPCQVVVVGKEEALPMDMQTLNGKGTLRRKLLFRAADPSVAARWSSLISQAFEEYKGRTGMTGVETSYICEPGETTSFKLPQIDCDFDPPSDDPQQQAKNAQKIPRDREIVWIAGVGERVVQGQVICEVMRGEKQNPAEVLSPATGKILQHIFVRSDPRSGVNYTRVGSAYVKMMTEPVWKPVYRYMNESNRKASSQGGGAAAGAPSGGGVPGEAQQLQPKKSIKKIGKSIALFSRMGKLAAENAAINDQTQVTAAHFERLVDRAKIDDATGFWQTAKKFTPEGTSRPMGRPGEESNTIKTINERYSLKAREAAAVLLRDAK